MTSLKAVCEILSKRVRERNSEILVRNAISGAVEEYEVDISAKVSDKDREKINYRAEKVSVIKAVGAMVLDVNKTLGPIPEIILPPNAEVAITSNRGFKFVTATLYSD